MSDNQDREIDWQAILYISGDMAPADAETFEDLLAIDQEAREAVAAAAILLGKLVASRPKSTHSRPVLPIRDRSTRRIAAVATMAASLLACWSLARTPHSRGRPSEEEARQLISFWSEAWSPSENGSADATADDEDSEVAVPSWMLAAVESSPPKAIEEK